MRLRVSKSALFLATFGLTALIFAGCSMSLTQYGLEEYPRTIPFFEPITLSYGGETLYLDTNLQRAYSLAIDTASYPMESCRGVAHIEASSLADNPPSSWNVGAAFIPFWPALPVEETWNYHMDVRIFCNGTLTFRASLDESEHVKAFWYGRMRADLINDASEEMHRKLIERLRFETRLSRTTDLNSAQDF